ncbi:hypothetical protein LCGC14_1981130 [marine sediment metagenome]|uniref:Uncharacterized protein n=1 Tax=marine sediment metagenome TaxID=412755 RepID=A0A0F9HM61_9ZZZZ
MSLLEPEGTCIVIGTPWHDDDLYQDLYHDDVFDRLSIPAFNKWFSADGVVHHDLIFPNKFSYKILMSKKKEIGPYLFSAQYLLDPYPDEAQEFKKAWFQYYKELPEDKYFITTVLDPSLGKKTSNHAGLTTTGINKAGDVYILEARRFKRMVDLIPAEVLKTVKKFKVNAFGLERFGFQQMLEGPIRRAFDQAGVKTTVELLPYMSEKKEVRIQSLIPLFSAGKVFMKEDMDDLLEELMKFSPVRKHNTDDIIDSLSWHNIFWDRKPTPRTELKEEYMSLNWWLGARKKKDIFWDFRKRNMKPVVLNFKHHASPN